MKKGFTLVELLVVIAIMSILTVVTVSQFQTAKRKANDVARKGDLNAVAKALQMYYSDYGKLPLASADGKIMVVDGDPIAWGEEFSDASGYIYMKTLPRENKLTTPYCYITDANRKVYALFAMLENTQDSQCISGSTYRCGNNSKEYCFAYYSPNIILNNDGSIKY